MTTWWVTIAQCPQALFPKASKELIRLLRMIGGCVLGAEDLEEEAWSLDLKRRINALSSTGEDLHPEDTALRIWYDSKSVWEGRPFAACSYVRRNGRPVDPLWLFDWVVSVALDMEYEDDVDPAWWKNLWHVREQGLITKQLSL